MNALYNLRLWLRDTLDGESKLFFDNDGEVLSSHVLQGLDELIATSSAVLDLLEFEGRDTGVGGCISDLRDILARLKPEPPKFNHMMDVAFTVIDEHENPTDIAYEDLLAGMQKRLDSLREVKEPEAFGHCDTHEEESPVRKIEFPKRFWMHCDKCKKARLGWNFEYAVCCPGTVWVAGKK